MANVNWRTIDDDWSGTTPLFLLFHMFHVVFGVPFAGLFGKNRSLRPSVQHIVDANRAAYGMGE